MACALTSLKLVDIQPSFKYCSLMPAGSSVSVGSLTDQELLQRLGTSGCQLVSSNTQTTQLPLAMGEKCEESRKSMPEQIALRKMVFPLFPAFVPATGKRVSKNKPSTVGHWTAWRRGYIHLPLLHVGTWIWG